MSSLRKFKEAVSKNDNLKCCIRCRRQLTRTSSWDRDKSKKRGTRKWRDETERTGTNCLSRMQRKNSRINSNGRTSIKESTTLWTRKISRILTIWKRETQIGRSLGALSPITQVVDRADGLVRRIQEQVTPKSSSICKKHWRNIGKTPKLQLIRIFNTKYRGIVRWKITHLMRKTSWHRLGWPRNNKLEIWSLWKNRRKEPREKNIRCSWIDKW